MLNNTVQVIDERQAAYRILDGRLPIMRISGTNSHLIKIKPSFTVLFDEVILE